MQKAAVPVFLAGLLCTILLLSCLSTEVSEEPVDQTEVEKKEQTETIQQLILTGKYDDAKAMFESQTNINMADENGNTPLHAAAQVNNADLITFLIYKGAETELKNAQGDTPLHVAIKYDSVDAARVLAAVNSDIFSRDTNGKTALELGIAKGKQFYDAMITTATGEKQDAQGLSIIHYFVRMNDRNAILYSISKQIPISRQDNSGMTPLGIAYRQNTQKSIEIAVDLLEAGAVPQGGNYEYFCISPQSRDKQVLCITCLHKMPHVLLRIRPDRHRCMKQSDMAEQILCKYYCKTAQTRMQKTV